MSSIPENKDELELAINLIFTKLMADYRLTPVSAARKCEIDGNVKGTKVSVSDTVAYLIGWGKLVLKWFHLRSQNQHVNFPETGYKWNQLGLLAESFHEEYRDWKYDDLLMELEVTVNDILLLISSLNDDELYGVAWYEKWTLGRMIQFNTSSPMKNVRTKVRRFNRNFI
ncbi:ClbS/DfsB family four-helix bundle protein [Pseudoalteromonas sp. KG3]|uniref:ClbS/DfsB family four-helix bundle protein n=1 Tax=Pseudoalteromonas prydzensis TaxID=182141 RepID=A0ABR9FHH2_9GAMM|nr:MULTISPECIES: ClbS/DfsB family four-helix bundle protein [Pseudoalteromonas]MBE0456260.1 ClbS/DfsB family four-helix bundle protein [Pseudoalteromonas prydzensis]WKD24167.1 ClbS/DfsB family four-helix bundle protein [Pseudoalteromonas sp. KG3]